jgi:hypothetical protein
MSRREILGQRQIPKDVDPRQPFEARVRFPGYAVEQCYGDAQHTQWIYSENSLKVELNRVPSRLAVALEREQENQRGVDEEDQNAKPAQQTRGRELRPSDLDTVIRHNTQHRHCP